MTERSYLSIGDVLSLLREEFPDITISKIRFLESRGLLVPERTPSGYRKFYDHDVDRLRWILRQQRENFLPLKVIKGRLEGQEPSSEPTPLFDVASTEPADREPVYAAQTVNGAAGRSEEPVAHAAHGRGGGPASALAARGAGAGGGPAVGERPRVGLPPTVPEGPVEASEVPDGEMESDDASVATNAASSLPASGGRPLAEAVAGRTGISDGGAQPSGSDLSTRARSAVTGEAASFEPPASAEETGEPSQQPSTSPSPGRVKHQPTAASPSASRPATSTGSGAEPAAPDTTATSGGKVPQPETPSGADVAALAGASLTASEMAQASGLGLPEIEELESFGLIESRTIAGVPCFDEDALIVAKLAASFGRFGVEARHLRLFKHAAERQASLYSQVVMPLLRQRNPQARRRAQDDLTRLSELGASLQTCFTKAVLRDLTRG